MQKTKLSPWKIEKETAILSSPAMSIIERQCTPKDEGKAPWNFYLLKAKDWCNVIPVTRSGNLVLIRQYRAGIDDYTLELPGGSVDNQDESIQAAAIREMIEETGFAPLEDARCIDLGSAHPNPAIMDNRVHSFIVGPVDFKKEQELDPGERIEVQITPIRELPELILSGRISHALMLNTFFRLMVFSDPNQTLLTKELSRYKDTKEF